MSTKKVTVAGNEYTIKKISLGERRVLNELKDPVESQATYIQLCTVEPKFETVESVYKLDGEEADGLFIEILDHNQPNKDFLQRSQKLFESVRLASEMNKPFSKQTTS